jgi:DNA topoisomerase-1
VEEKPYKSSPRPPYMTSTLQQEAGNRLRLSSSQVMRIAQGLYERGFITYMRTDSPTLSREALEATRAAVASEHGEKYLSPAPRQYTSKSSAAQEAHEAIRPTTPFRSPRKVAGELDRQEQALYQLIWQRTLASQMADAVGVTVSVRLAATSSHQSADCEFAASGTTITFPGHRAVYDLARGSGPASATDEEEGDSAKEALLPVLHEGDKVPVESLTPGGHTTTAPARFTEASLVKRLEELQIGRPSTWASIIQTVQDRGYVLKRGQALVPTWTAFAVVGLLEGHFRELVDYANTAKIEEDLDRIAEGKEHKEDWLRRFYFGDEGAVPGLKRLVESNLDLIDAAAINTFLLGKDDEGREIVVKPGKWGPYVKRGDDTAGVPDDLAPDELTVEKAIELLSMPKGDAPIGTLDGLPVYAKNGRFGPYVQWGDAKAPPPGLAKPKMASLFKTMALEGITLEDAKRLLELPRSLGADLADGKEIVANNGRYGPYIVKDKDFRTIESEEQLFTISVEEASGIFAQPKVFRRGATRNLAAAGPLRTFGDDPVSKRPVVAKDGRFGVYVTDGETNASIGKGDRIEHMEPERAFELLAIRRESAAIKGDGPKRKGKTAGKKPAAKAAGTATKKAVTAKPAASAKKATKKSASKKKAKKKPAAGTKSAAKKPFTREKT